MTSRSSGSVRYRQSTIGLSSGLDSEFNPFEDEREDDARSKIEVAVCWLREELELPARSRAELPFKETPVFLGHGTVDEKVPVELDRSTSDLLNALGVKVQWHEYEGLGHCYSEDMLSDVSKFLSLIQRSNGSI